MSGSFTEFSQQSSVAVKQVRAQKNLPRFWPSLAKISFVVGSQSSELEQTGYFVVQAVFDEMTLNSPKSSRVAVFNRVMAAGGDVGGQTGRFG